MCGGYSDALIKDGDRAGPQGFGAGGLAFLRRLSFLRNASEQTNEQADQWTQDSLSETKGKSCEMEGREMHERGPLTIRLSRHSPHKASPHCERRNLAESSAERFRAEFLQNIGGKPEKMRNYSDKRELFEI